jgi:hypothetical protein
MKSVQNLMKITSIGQITKFSISVTFSAILSLIFAGRFPISGKLPLVLFSVLLSPGSKFLQRVQNDCITQALRIGIEVMIGPQLFALFKSRNPEILNSMIFRSFFISVTKIGLRIQAFYLKVKISLVQVFVAIVFEGLIPFQIFWPSSDRSP